MGLFNKKVANEVVVDKPNMTTEQTQKIVTFSEKCGFTAEKYLAKDYVEGLEAMLEDTLSETEKLMKQYAGFNKPLGSQELPAPVSFKNVAEALEHYSNSGRIKYKEALELVKTKHPELFKKEE